MDILLQSATLVVTLLVLLGLGIWVGVTLLASAVVIFMIFTSTPVEAILGTTMWVHSASWTLTALPLFIWMGEILYRTRLAEDLFSGLAPWVGRLPGGLAHVNVIGCGIFAAVSGSSAATTATVGPYIAARVKITRLCRPSGYRLSRGVGHTWPFDPSVNCHDCVRCRGTSVDQPPIHRRRSARTNAHGVIFGLHRHLVKDESRWRTCT